MNSSSAPDSAVPLLRERCDRLQVWRRAEVEASPLLHAVRAALAAHPVPRDRVQPPPQGVWLIHGGARADVVGVRQEGREWAIKYFHDRRWRARLRNGLGFGKALKAFAKGLQLELQGLAGPRVLGLAEVRPWGPCLLIMDYLPGTERLEDLLSRRASSDPKDPQQHLLRKLARETGRFAGQMHQAGITHQDFSSRNLLVADPLTHPRFFLVDFEDLRFSRWNEQRRQRADLLALDRDVPNVPPRERLRFLHHYALTRNRRTGDVLAMTCDRRGK